MFAGLLNKGFRASLAVLGLFFLAGFLLNYFAVQSLEKEYYPNLFYNYLTRNLESKFSINLLNFLFIALGVFLVHMITTYQEIVDKLNYFPAFLFLLLSISCANPFQLTSQVFTNVIILYALYKLLQTYRQEQALSPIFEAAFLLSLATFITISTIISIPLFFFVLLILRPFYWREWAVGLLGLLTPIFFYECIAYLTNFNQWYLFYAVKLYFKSFSTPSFSEYFLPLSAALFLLLLISILSNLIAGFGNTVKKQRTKSILLWYLLFATAGFFSGGTNSASIILTYAFPTSIFVGDFLFSIRQKKITNTLLILIIALASIIFIAQLNLI